MQLEEVGDAPPAQCEQPIEALGMKRHCGATRREIVRQRAQRQFDQNDGGGLKRFDKPGR